MPNCPQCGMWLVKQAPRRGAFETILRFVAIGPLRCQLCTNRFLAVLWGLIALLVHLAFLVIFIVTIIKAFTNVRWDIPYIGPIARKQIGETA